MKAYWGWRYNSTHSLTLSLDGGEWSASRPGRFTPKERAIGIYEYTWWDTQLLSDPVNVLFYLQSLFISNEYKILESGLYLCLHVGSVHS
jgi:hypothetical protein